VFILEVFFKKGYFSRPPENLFEFLLFCFWAFVLSIPFNLFDVYSTKTLYQTVRTNVIDAKIIEEQILEDELNKFKKANKKNDEIVDSTLQLLAIQIYLIILYIIHKYLISHYSYLETWKINAKILHYVNAVIICLPIIYILAYSTHKILDRVFMKKFLKDSNVG
jgi:hypothetical protein